MDIALSLAEADRLATLEHYDILDTGKEPEFQAIVQIARMTLKAPIVLVSLVDKDRQWFKARIGLDLAETPRHMSFCTHTIMQEDMLIVPDALEDERFADHPLVTGYPQLRFYAGASLKAPNGCRLGTVCAIDTRPRPGLFETQVATMERLAAETIAAMERRLIRQQLAA